MRYQDHPLMDFSRRREWPQEDLTADHTPGSFPAGRFPSPLQRLKAVVGRILYPAKNALQRSMVERKLRGIGCRTEGLRPPEVMTWGQKGHGLDRLLRRAGALVKPGCIVAALGCGMAEEYVRVANILKPRKIIGYEFFNYRRAWEYVARLVPGVELEFLRVDLRKPLPTPPEPADLLYSYTVLEHFRDLEESLANARPALKDSGMFAALWGPLWFSYAGDHFSSGPGFEWGFEHVHRPAEAYMQWRRQQAKLPAEKPTWLDLGLNCFARYDEYLPVLNRLFGPTRWLLWQISTEAFAWQKAHPQKWNELLQRNPDLQPLDLVLGGVESLCGPAGPV